jgi:hypothetical protein
VDRDGRESKSVLIIRWTETYNKNQDYVKYATKYTQKRLSALWVNQDQTQIIDVNDFEVLDNIFSEINNRWLKYSEIIIIWHWTDDSILLWNGKNGYLNSDNVSQLSMDESFNTPIRLESCNTGYGKDSIGAQLSSALWTTVIAPDNFIVVYPEMNYMNVEWYFHWRPDSLLQKMRETILPDRWFQAGAYNTFIN